MKGTTTRRLTTGAVVLGLLLAGGAALGQQGFRGGREGAPGRGIRAALGALDLTDAQKEKVKALVEADRPRLQALREEGRTAREALRAAVRAEKPDPTAVGTAFLRLDAHRKAVREARESERAKLESILTAEQKAKLEGWREAHRQMRGSGWGAGPRGLGRPGSGPAFN